MTEDRKELSEILLGNTKQSSNGKKAVLIVIASIVIIVVVAFGMWKLLGSKEEKVAKPSNIVDTDIMKPAEKDFGNDFGNFGNLDNLNSPGSNDFGSLDFGNTPLQSQDLGFGLDSDGMDANNSLAQDESTNASNSIDDALKAIEDSIKSEPQKPAQTTKEPAKPSAPAATKDSAKEPAKPAPKAESKPDSKIDSKPAAAKEPTKPSTPAQSAAKDSAKEPTKPAPKPESKPAQASAPSNQASAPASTSSAQTTAARNGSAPTQGFYWQVGAFEKEPNAEFMALIKKYPYRIQHTKIDNIPTTRYLIGPYASRPQAPNREEIANIFKENPTPVEIQ